MGKMKAARRSLYSEVHLISSEFSVFPIFPGEESSLLPKSPPRPRLGAHPNRFDPLCCILRICRKERDSSPTSTRRVFSSWLRQGRTAADPALLNLRHKVWEPPSSPSLGRSKPNPHYRTYDDAREPRALVSYASPMNRVGVESALVGHGEAK